MKLISFCLLVFGILYLLGFKLNGELISEFKVFAIKLYPKGKKENKCTLKSYIIEVEGKRKDNPFRKATAEAKTALENIGQKNKFRNTQIGAYICSSVAFIVSFLLLKNIMLSAVLAAGCYVLPLWCTRFYVYRYTREVNEELSVALSMITTSYIRTSDIQSAVAENLEYTNGVVHAAFSAFINYLKINPSMVQALTQLKKDVDSPLFRQWVDTVILCQEDHALRFALNPTVQKFSTLKMLQMENETKMIMPLRYALIVVGVTALFIPLIYGLQPTWYTALTTSFFGQVSLTIAAISSIFMLNKAIKLSGPIEFSI